MTQNGELLLKGARMLVAVDDGEEVLVIADWVNGTGEVFIDEAGTKWYVVGWKSHEPAGEAEGQRLRSARGDVVVKKVLGVGAR